MLALLAAGCGGASIPTPPAGTGQTPPAAAIDSCTLLSDEEIEVATGHGVLERSASTLTQVFPSVCDIDLEDGGSLTVSVLQAGGRSMYENSFEPFIGEGDFAPLDEAVTDLGDKAGRSGDDELMVLEGDVLFDILYIEFGRRDKFAAVRYLAEVILAKLPCLAAGCPGFTPPPAPSSPPAIDVCALLTDDEIERATGYPVLDSEPAGGNFQDASCRWTLDADPSLPGLYWIEMEVMASGGRDQFDFLAEEAYVDPPEHVPGLGDDAIKTATIPAGQVYAVVGDRLVTLSFSMPLFVDDPYVLVVPLVETALGRLGRSD
jgi:hypothetical protein